MNALSSALNPCASRCVGSECVVGDPEVGDRCTTSGRLGSRCPQDPVQANDRWVIRNSVPLFSLMVVSLIFCVVPLRPASLLTSALRSHCP